MVLDFFRSGSEGSLEKIEQQVQEMLADNETTFALATDAVFGRVDPEGVGKELRKSDRQVNRGERSIRRELIVHAGVAGPADYPLMLVYMSIIKDIERIGDYAKNIWDVAAAIEKGVDKPDLSELTPLFTRTLELMAEIGEIYAARDVDRATEVLNRADNWLDEYDEAVENLMTSYIPSTVGVPKALLYRHLKRVTAHLMNVLTAVVMPFDRLDYWDEDKIDRE